MSPGVFHLDDDGKLTSVVEHAYEVEAELQRLLAAFPDLLGADRDEPDPPRFVLVRREAGVPQRAGGPTGGASIICSLIIGGSLRWSR